MDSVVTSKSRLRLWLRVLKLSRLIENELRERFRKEFNSTLPRFDVLASLERHSDGLRMSELSTVLRVSNGNVTGIVDRLVEEGLVVRVAVPGDRRASLVKLTDDGRSQFALQAEAHERWINELLAMFPEEQAELLAKQLELGLPFGKALGEQV
ncbi:MarR family transcriptional regulator [Rhodobacteraceae bacterium RKSG542]|uniref:MarR family winged helix-turn-helix transcriptional regulator n=1 Tax=Pseudovibrio flavus TaxID=2529854 RepID=UPI0012BD0865|nr:MarR family transcriptional regulator [Pseudovibrio flavus]MTI16169.1 MarR family transcriptional regulator [Pseudovibrio flavus]